MALERTTKKRKVGWVGRGMLCVLAAALLCALPTQAFAADPAPVPDTGVVAVPKADKPIVTIQGNAVIDDSGKATGFYELALCVQTKSYWDVVTNPTVATQVSKADYLKDIEDHPENETNGKYKIVESHAFRSAAATVTVDTDVLTPVGWETPYPVYAAWDKVTGKYTDKAGADVPQSYAWGIDRAAEGMGSIPDVTMARLGRAITSVRMETLKPDEISVAGAQVEDYDEAGHQAVITLTGGAPLNGVCYDEPTPVVVIRFAYDKLRFPNTLIAKATPTKPVDFAVAVNEGAAGPRTITYMSADDQAAGSFVNQSVWYEGYIKDTTQETAFYYYLGADLGSGAVKAPQDELVVKPDGTSAVMSLARPDTAGKGVLAYDAAGNYSYTYNILQSGDGTLRLTFVNAKTYKKSASDKGVQVLFYDWDNTLIGATVVGRGDARKQINDYVEKNFIHPQLRASDRLAAMGGAVDDTSVFFQDYERLTDSLEREFTYRGKYAYKVGQDGDDSLKDEENGSEYPLTNKLDYAFYRRVNLLSTETVDGVTTTYVTPTPVSAAAEEDANLYPYVYGWALVEDNSQRNVDEWQLRRDALKLEDTWTTFGVGELSGMDPGAAGEPIPGTATPPEMPEGVAPPTTYAYSTSTGAANGYLRFADFSDVSAMVEKTGKDAIIVKAVYEPGPALLNGISYRLIKDPAYNKLNTMAASRGGAFSAVITMERSSLDTGSVQGVSRTRLPAVRQDTTADQKWIADAALGVDHNLDNATIQTAKGLSETTYTKVDIDNGEIIQFTMSLSARQNRVDYYIIEQYGNNFVAGAQRSQTNYNKQDNEYVVSNYNYYSLEDSDISDNFFDVVNYEDREGSHGFVLYGTLNNIMQAATQYNQEEIDDESIEGTITYLTLADANLRGDANGTVVSATAAAKIRAKILAAAQDCEQNHKGDPKYWDNELDCARLTYHQLQWYIIDGVLLSPEAAENDNHKLTFCHLHTDCAELTMGKPTDWDSLITAAREGGDKIEKLLVGEIEGIAHLRADSAGSAFTSITDFKDMMVMAVNAFGCQSWDEVQYAILNLKKPDANGIAEARANYWWYDGATNNPVPSSFTQLLTMGKAALAPPVPPPPDGDTTPRTAKLQEAKGPANANAGQMGENTTAAWRNLTHNLVMAFDDATGTERFPDGDTFLAALLDALDAAGSAPLTDTKEDWQRLQYHILHKDDPGYAGFPASPPAECADYYWYDGGKRIVDLKSLMDAAKEAAAGNTDTWDSFDKTMFSKFRDKDDPFWHRFADQFAMTRFLDVFDADFDFFKAKVLEYVQVPGANRGTNKDMTWNELQYMLMSDPEHTPLDIAGAKNEAAAGFYWWKTSATPPSYDLTYFNFQTNVGSAAFAAAMNGNTAAWDSLTQETLDRLNLKIPDSAADLGFTQLTGTPAQDKDANGDPAMAKEGLNTRDDIPTVTLAQFKTTMETLIRNYAAAEIAAGTGHGHTVPIFELTEIQYALLNNGDYIADSAMPMVTVGKGQFKNAYWWMKQKDVPNLYQAAPPPPPPAPATWNTLKTMIAGNPAGVTVPLLSGLKLRVTATSATIAPAALNMVKQRLAKLKTAAGAANVAKLSWYQVQFAMLSTTGQYVTHEAAVAASAAWNWVPDWAPSTAP